MIKKPLHKSKRFRAIFLIALILLVATAFYQLKPQEHNDQISNQPTNTIISGSFDKNMAKSDAEWKNILSPEQYHVLREAGTEIPFTGDLNNEKRKGTYYSVGCDVPLFRSEQKFDSGTGWPSFSAPINEDSLVLRRETGLGDDRIEVLDPCGGHLGHVFDDGPEPTGKRYCMNSVALRFVPDEN